MNRLSEIKILVVSNMYPSQSYPNYGTFVKNFCNQLDTMNVNYEKVVKYREGNKIITYIKYYFKIMSTIIKNNYDIIYVHYPSHNAIPLILLSKLKNIHLYTNVHGGDVVPQTKVQKIMNIFTCKVLELSEKIIVPSKYFKELMHEQYNIANEKIKIYPSAGVNEKIFFLNDLVSKEDVEIKYFMNDNFKYIGYIGRIEPQKGWDTFLKAIYILKSQGQMINKKVIVIGNGIEFNKFESMIKELELEEYITHIKFLNQEKLPAIYNQMDVFCFPTERRGESLGLVALEALACGTPVIASDFAAPKDYIIEGFNGYKFSKGDSTELALKITKFFDDSEEHNRVLSYNAVKSCEKYYTSNLKESLIDIFIDLKKEGEINDRY